MIECTLLTSWRDTEMQHNNNHWQNGPKIVVAKLEMTMEYQNNY